MRNRARSRCVIIRRDEGQAQEITLAAHNARVVAHGAVASDHEHDTPGFLRRDLLCLLEANGSAIGRQFQQQARMRHAGCIDEMRGKPQAPTRNTPLFTDIDDFVFCLFVRHQIPAPLENHLTLIHDITIYITECAANAR